MRVPQIEYHFIARTLDFGALGVMIPNVKSGAEARAIVDAAKYAPMGKRGVIMGNAQTDFLHRECGRFYGIRQRQYDRHLPDRKRGRA